MVTPEERRALISRGLRAYGRTKAGKAAMRHRVQKAKEARDYQTGRAAQRMGMSLKEYRHYLMLYSNHKRNIRPKKARPFFLWLEARLSSGGLEEQRRVWNVNIGSKSPARATGEPSSAPRP